MQQRARIFLLCCLSSFVGVALGATASAQVTALKAFANALNVAGWTNKWPVSGNTDPCSTPWYILSPAYIEQSSERRAKVWCGMQRCQSQLCYADQFAEQRRERCPDQCITVPLRCLSHFVELERDSGTLFSFLFVHQVKPHMMEMQNPGAFPSVITASMTTLTILKLNRCYFYLFFW